MINTKYTYKCSIDKNVGHITHVEPFLEQLLVLPAQKIFFQVYLFTYSWFFLTL